MRCLPHKIEHVKDTSTEQNRPVTPPSLAEPLTRHFAMNPLLTSHISTGSPKAFFPREIGGLSFPSLLPPLSSKAAPITDVRVFKSGGSRLSCMCGLGTTLGDADSAGPDPEDSALDTIASSHSYAGPILHRTLRTGNEVCKVYVGAFGICASVPSDMTSQTLKNIENPEQEQ